MLEGMPGPRPRKTIRGASTKPREYVVNWWSIESAQGSKPQELTSFRVSGSTLPEAERNVRDELKRRKRRVRSFSFSADGRILVIVFAQLQEPSGLDHHAVQLASASAHASRVQTAMRLADESRGRRAAVRDPTKRPKVQRPDRTKLRVTARTAAAVQFTRKKKQLLEQRAAAQITRTEQRVADKVGAAHKLRTVRDDRSSKRKAEKVQTVVAQQAKQKKAHEARLAKREKPDRRGENSAKAIVAHEATQVG